MRAHTERGATGVVKRTLVAFYDDQMTHHAAALTYYGLMSLFPAVLLGLSLLGLLGQYPETYDAIIGYLHEVAPDSLVTALDRSLEQALQNKGTAATALVISAAIAFYGTTGVLEACRRALNVVFEVDGGRSFFRRKLVDVVSTIVLLALGLVTGILVFVGGGFAADLLGFIGLGPEAAEVWSFARWPAALLSAMLAFSFIYYITPDVEPRAWHWVTPGAVAGVLLWLAASWGFSTYISSVADVGAVYGAFAGAIVLVVVDLADATSRCCSAPSSTRRSSARRSCARASRRARRSTAPPARREPGRAAPRDVAALLRLGPAVGHRAPAPRRPARVVEEEPAAAGADVQAGELPRVGEQVRRGEREPVDGRHRVSGRERPAGARDERPRGERRARGGLDGGARAVRRRLARQVRAEQRVERVAEAARGRQGVRGGRRVAEAHAPRERDEVGRGRPARRARAARRPGRRSC